MCSSSEPHCQGRWPHDPVQNPSPAKGSLTFTCLKTALPRSRNESIQEQMFEEYFWVICLTRQISYHLPVVLEQLQWVLLQNNLSSCLWSAADESALSSWRLGWFARWKVLFHGHTIYQLLSPIFLPSAAGWQLSGNKDQRGQMLFGKSGHLQKIRKPPPYWLSFWENRECFHLQGVCLQPLTIWNCQL